MATAGFNNILKVCRQRDFALFMGGKLCYQITGWMYRTATAWLVWDMTGSATWLGIVSFVDHVPSIVISPLAGVLTDRIDRKKVLNFTQVHACIQAAILAFLVLTDGLTIEILVALAFYHGLITGAQGPAGHAILPQLIERDLLTTAYGLNAVAFNLSRFIGPAIAGIIISQWSVGPAILCNAFGAVCFFIAIRMLHADFKVIATKQQTASFWSDFVAGARYASRHKGIGPLMTIMVLLGILTFSIVDLLPGFADGVFNKGANGLAWMISVLGIGATIQGVMLAQRGPIAGLTRYVTHFIAVMGLAFLVLASTDIYWVGLAAVFVIGYATAANRVGPLTLMQSAVDPDMRGRVASFWMMIYQVAPAVGALVIGAIADVFGMGRTFIVIGVLTLALWLWVTSRLPRLAPALERNPDETVTGRD